MSSRSSSRAAAAHQFPAMARLRAAVAAPRSNRVRAGARLSHQASYRSATCVAESGADGAGVAADDLADGHLADAEGAGDAGRAVAHHVQGPQPQPGAAGVHAAARDSSGWSRRAPRWWCRGSAGGGRGPGQRRWPGPGPRRRRCRGRCRRPAAGGGRERGPGRAGGRVRRASWARDGTGLGVDAHLSSPPRPGDRAVRGGPGRSGGRSPGSG